MTSVFIPSVYFDLPIDLTIKKLLKKDKRTMMVLYPSPDLITLKRFQFSY